MRKKKDTSLKKTLILSGIIIVLALVFVYGQYTKTQGINGEQKTQINEKKKHLSWEEFKKNGGRSKYPCH